MRIATGSDWLKSKKVEPNRCPINFRRPDQVSLTRSVVLNLARLFKAGDERKKSRVVLATPEKGPNSIVAAATTVDRHLIPALKRRAKFKAPLRVAHANQRFRKLVAQGSRYWTAHLLVNAWYSAT